METASQEAAREVDREEEQELLDYAQALGKQGMTTVSWGTCLSWRYLCAAWSLRHEINNIEDGEPLSRPSRT
eukprot:COSAG01_NODE_12939_length_1660_cov_0.933376_1_plen_72_part_00